MSKSAAKNPWEEFGQLIRSTTLILTACELARFAGETEAGVETFFPRAKALLESGHQFLSGNLQVIIGAVHTEKQLERVTKAILSDSGGGDYDWARMIAHLEGMRQRRADRIPQPITIASIAECLKASRRHKFRVKVIHLLDRGVLPKTDADQIAELWMNLRRKRTAGASAGKRTRL